MRIAGELPGGINRTNVILALRTMDMTHPMLLDGVRFHRDVIETETVVMRSITGTVRWIRAEHRQLEKFHLD